ncbi:hypothetical protein PR048_025386 [Dryococelus australis]|uniref:Uncharacterized protein n=1 Tax=Dryococelus australis TaxID=614101 RepID=A0ABQ9GR74_9NEOP|nr:hypothetical protein PR048_025386 [Dryococelus australis]
MQEQPQNARAGETGYHLCELIACTMHLIVMRSRLFRAWLPVAHAFGLGAVVHVEGEHVQSQMSLVHVLLPQLTANHSITLWRGDGVANWRNTLANHSTWLCCGQEGRGVCTPTVGKECSVACLSRVRLGVKLTRCQAKITVRIGAACSHPPPPVQRMFSSKKRVLLQGHASPYRSNVMLRKTCPRPSQGQDAFSEDCPVHGYTAPTPSFYTSLECVFCWLENSASPTPAQSAFSAGWRTALSIAMYSHPPPLITSPERVFSEILAALSVGKSRASKLNARDIAVALDAGSVAVALDVEGVAAGLAAADVNILYLDVVGLVSADINILVLDVVDVGVFNPNAGGDCDSSKEGIDKSNGCRIEPLSSSSSSTKSNKFLPKHQSADFTLAATRPSAGSSLRCLRTPGAQRRTILQIPDCQLECPSWLKLSERGYNNDQNILKNINPLIIYAGSSSMCSGMPLKISTCSSDYPFGLYVLLRSLARNSRRSHCLATSLPRPNAFGFLPLRPRKNTGIRHSCEYERREELEDRFRAAFETIKNTPAIFNNVLRNMLQRCRECIERGGNNSAQLLSEFSSQLLVAEDELAASCSNRMWWRKKTFLILGMHGRSTIADDLCMRSLSVATGDADAFHERVFTKRTGHAYQGACRSRPWVSGVFETSEECSGLLTSCLSARLGVLQRNFIGWGIERVMTNEKRSVRRVKWPAGGKSATASINAANNATGRLYHWTRYVYERHKIIKPVHDNVNTFEINLRKKSLPLPALYFNGRPE